jgi:NADH dehydrogenase
MTTDTGRTRVVVIGAGFGGLASARTLGEAGIDVTVVDRNNFHTFLPLLYQVATAGLNPADVAYPVRGIFRRHPSITFRQAGVAGVDWDRRTLLLDTHDAPDDHEVLRTLTFDHLIVAAGATANYFGVEGAEEHGFPLYELDDAVRLRNHLLRRFEAADADPRAVEDGAMTVVIVGGGPTGVELAGAAVELVHGVLRKDFPHLDTDRARVVLVEMGPELLAPFTAKSRRSALETLRQRGVEVRLGTSVVSVGPDHVRLGDDETINAHTLVWAAGVQASPLAKALQVEVGRGGRVVVDDMLAISGRDGAYAVGDVAAIPVPGEDAPLPQLAQVAMQSGKHAAEQIIRAAKGQEPKPFRYFNKGTMATIGRRAAVAELPGRIRLRGTIGWLSWLFLHLVMLVGFRNRVSVFLNWAWNYLTWDRGARLILDPPPRPPAPRSLPSGDAVPEPGDPNA